MPHFSLEEEVEADGDNSVSVIKFVSIRLLLLVRLVITPVAIVVVILVRLEGNSVRCPAKRKRNKPQVAVRDIVGEGNNNTMIRCDSRFVVLCCRGRPVRSWVLWKAEILRIQQ
jgi:hypothetical protein